MDRVLPKHPWDKWFNKASTIIKRGTHFDGRTHAMAQQIRNAAGKRGVTVSLDVDFDDKGSIRIKVL